VFRKDTFSITVGEGKKRIRNLMKRIKFFKGGERRNVSKFLAFLRKRGNECLR